LICHATETSAAILALAITVIEARFQAPLIASIGLPQLFLPGLLPTFCTAVGLSSIAGEADEKHLPAARSAAKQLSKYKSSPHCLPLPPRREWTRAGRCAKLNSVVVVLFTLRGPLETETPIVAAIGVFHSSPVDSNLPESLRHASAMMLRMRDSLSNRAGVLHSSPHRLSLRCASAMMLRIYSQTGA
jgi:hypothetical protein